MLVNLLCELFNFLLEVCYSSMHLFLHFCHGVNNSLEILAYLIFPSVFLLFIELCNVKDHSWWLLLFFTVFLPSFRLFRFPFDDCVHISQCCTLLGRSSSWRWYWWGLSTGQDFHGSIKELLLQFFHYLFRSCKCRIGIHSIKYVFTNEVASVSVSCGLLAIHNIYVYAALVLLYGHVPISIATPSCSFLPMRTLQTWPTVVG